jgi:hypothetical protein
MEVRGGGLSVSIRPPNGLRSSGPSSPAHFQMAFDFADGPALGPVKPVQVIDLFGVEHRLAALCGSIDGHTSRVLFARRRPRRSGSASITQICAGAELLFVRFRPGRAPGYLGEPETRSDGVLGPRRRPAVVGGRLTLAERFSAHPVARRKPSRMNR